MNNYESDKMSPKGSKAIGDGNPDCRPKQDLKVSNDHQKNNPRSTCESSCPASESARERKNSPQITPTDKVSNDIVQPRRSARLAKKRERVNKIGLLRRELQNLSVLQQKILRVAEQKEPREEMSRDRAQASHELERSSGAETQRAARRGDRYDDQHTDNSQKRRFRSRESVKKDRRMTNESTRRQSDK